MTQPEDFEVKLSIKPHWKLPPETKEDMIDRKIIADYLSKKSFEMAEDIRTRINDELKIKIKQIQDAD